MGFRPTPAPLGRLVHLAVVLDASSTAAEQLVRMCDRIRVDDVWLCGDGSAALATRVRPLLQHAGLGIVAGGAPPRVTVPAHVAARVARGSDAAHVGPASDHFSHRLSAVVPGSDLDAAVRSADDVVLFRPPAADVPALVDEVRGACHDAGRDPGTLGIALQVGVAVGRTSAEAETRRALAPEMFVAEDGSDSGIVGRLEDCQEQVIVHAHQGVTELRCEVPMDADVPDMLGQLLAMVAGDRERLRPGTARSRDPDPPAGWGGPKKVR